MVLFLFIAGGLGTASARVGWTLEECVQQYGKPYLYDKRLNSYSFRVGDVGALAYFLRGLVGKMTHVKAGGGEFTDEEINILLRKNGGERKWRKVWDGQRSANGNVSSSWVTNDHYLVAVYVSQTNDSTPLHVTITTWEMRRSDEQRYRDEAEKELNSQRSSGARRRIRDS